MANSNQLPSNRNFGFFFSILFVLLSAYAAYRNIDFYIILSLLILGVAVGVVAMITQDLLMPFNKAWMRLGELMGMVVSPFILGVIFFLAITPVALFGRLFGRDELRLRMAKVSSYWIDRVESSPDKDSFKNQF